MFQQNCAWNKGHYLNLLVVESFLPGTQNSSIGSTQFAQERPLWRNLISAAWVCDLILSFSSQSLRPQLRIGMKIELRVWPCDSAFSLLSWPIAELLYRCSWEWLVNPCIYPQCIAIYLGQRHEDSTHRVTVHTEALDGNSARPTIESNRCKHHVSCHCNAQ